MHANRSRFGRRVAAILSLVVLASVALPAAAMAGVDDCKFVDGWKFTKVTRTALEFKPTTSIYGAENRTGSTSTVTFKTDESGTVGMKVSIGAKAQAGVILASAETTFGLEFYGSLTTSIGVSTTINVPPRSGGYGQYGVRRYVIKGHYYYLNQDCSIGTDYGYISANLPERKIWKTWTEAL